MLQSRKFWFFLICAATLLTAFIFLFNYTGTREKALQLITPDLIEEKGHLKNENAYLKSELDSLKKLNRSLRKYLDLYEINFIELKKAVKDCYPIESVFPDDFPEELISERFEIRQLFRELLSEKKRWDQYQQAQYKGILEKTLEPVIIESQSLKLENKENMQYFLELESALKLHKRLIRDVRLFHDEIQYQKQQLHTQQEYELYDLKFKLDPFARESALVDALQQAMSALSTGIYQQEAVEVLDRIGDEFTKPIQQLCGQQKDATATPVPTKYNYNFYTVFGKKLMDYSNTLAQQSSITLGPSAFGELDFFNRRLSDSLYDLYQVGQYEAINPSNLDLDELEQVLYSRH
jgi:hypothetical protein